MAPEQILESQITVAPLNRGINLDSFDCGDGDLNDFLKKDSFSYSEKGIARTYVCLFQNQPVGFFSICADAIRLSVEERNSEFGKQKAHPDYPALKIARLAVSKNFQKRGIGAYMVKLVIGKAFGISEQIGCRFVTVDAYAKNESFYRKLGFLNNQEDRSGQNISMRFDLIDAIRS